MDPTPSGPQAQSITGDTDQTIRGGFLYLRMEEEALWVEELDLSFISCD